MHVSGELDLEKCFVISPRDENLHCWRDCTLKLCTLASVDPRKEIDYTTRRGAWEVYRKK